MFQIKLQAVRNKLTKSEIKIADYLIENIGDLETMNSYDLAHTLGIGQATSVRFAKKLGYKTFRDLTEEIKGMDYENIYENEINVKEHLDLTNLKIVNQYKKIIEFTHDLNSSDDFMTIIRLISGASNIVIFGIGNSSIAASDFYKKLKMIGFNIFYSSDVHLTFSVISKLTEDDLLILISDSGETSEVIKAAELAKENDILTESITNFVKNKLNSITDFVLKSINFDLDMDVRIDSTASRISQLMILDTLFINILKEDFDKYKKMIQVNNKAVKRLR